MLNVNLKGAGKRFQYDWIFKNLSIDIHAGEKCVITGSNGSGKSTLLKSISCISPLTEGEIEFQLNGEQIKEGEIYPHLVISAPYLELPEEFTLLELLQFHFKFKNPIKDWDFNRMMERMYLKEHQHKPINQFSSGMKQRLKIGLCLFSDVPLVLLDEPSSNLDEKGLLWYLEMIGDFGDNRTIIVSSNEPREYGFCKKHIPIENYKPRQKL